MEQSKIAGINFRKLFYFILQKWRIILTVVLVGTILVSIFALIMEKSYLTSDAEIISLKKEMTKEEVKRVEDAASVIASYYELYDQQKNYNTNSILQRIDPYGVKQVILTYYVNNNYVVTYPVIEENNNITSIVQVYSSLAKDSNILSKMNKDIDQKIKDTYYGEAITVDTSMASSGTFTITIVGFDYDIIDKMAAIVKDGIESNLSAFEEAYGNHDIVLASELKSEIVDMDMVTLQQDNLGRLSSISSAIASEEKCFSGVQASYLDYLIDEDIETHNSFIKYVVLGLLVSLIISILVICVNYIVAKKVRQSNELEILFDIPVIGKIKTRECANKFDALFYDNRFLDYEMIEENTINKIGTRIGAISKVNDVKKLAIVSNGVLDEKSLDSLKDTKGVEVSVVNNYINSSELGCLNDYIASDAIVLMGEIDSTTYDELKEIINLCEIDKKRIVGIIMTA